MSVRGGVGLLCLRDEGEAEVLLPPVLHGEPLNLLVKVLTSISQLAAPASSCRCWRKPSAGVRGRSLESQRL